MYTHTHINCVYICMNIHMYWGLSEKVPKGYFKASDFPWGKSVTFAMAPAVPSPGGIASRTAAAAPPSSSDDADAPKPRSVGCWVAIKKW